MFNTTWNSDLVIGIDDIDQCHKYIIRMINEAYDGYALGVSTEDYIVEDILISMSECFDFEQMLMMESCYPEFLAHRDEHELFRQRIIDAHRRTRQPEATAGGWPVPVRNTAVELLMVLDHWINSHIRDCDAKLGDYMKTMEPCVGVREIA